VSLVKAKKTYHCKVIRLTNTKQVALQQEYDNLQHYLQTREDRGLYSANRQQADRFYKVIKKTTKYPLSIRNDLIRLEHDPSYAALGSRTSKVSKRRTMDWINKIIRTNSKRCQDLRV